MSKSDSKVWQLKPEIIKRIDLFLEEIYPDSEKMGEKMAKREAALQTSQARGLENLTVSTSRFSEIINYIKNQAGKSARGKGWNIFAEEMLLKLKVIENKAREIGGNDPGTVLEVKLGLARGWVKQVVAHYLYEKTREKGGNHDWK
ncbi:MAG: hypothetical protein GY950_37300 [bacterium]|nr:hypothetical protein [bacterium]